MTRVAPPSPAPDATEPLAAARTAGQARWGRLPEPVQVADLRESQPAGNPLDPSTVYDPERDWLIRYGAAGL